MSNITAHILELWKCGNQDFPCITMCRWRRSLIKKVIQQNKHWNDSTVSPVIRQSLLHWAYELTEEDFDRTRQDI